MLHFSGGRDFLGHVMRFVCDCGVSVSIEHPEI